MSVKLYEVLGFAGVSKAGETKHIWQCALVLQSVIMMINIWLPLEGFLYVKDYISWLSVVIMTWIFWGVFVLFSLGLILLVKKKGHYLWTNWLNFLNILVAFPIFWLFGVNYETAYIWQMIVLILMSLPWMVMVFQALSAQRTGAILLVFLVFTVLGAFILGFVDMGIGDPWTGIWWAFQTITTLGYGDVVPETYLGQVFAIIFMICGILFLALLSASITYYLLRNKMMGGTTPKKALDYDFDEMNERLKNIEKALLDKNKKSQS